MVIHLTDGEPTDGDPLPYAEALKSLSTDDGELLLFNCHISESQANPVVFPNSEHILPRRAGEGPVPDVERAARQAARRGRVEGRAVRTRGAGHGLQRRRGPDAAADPDGHRGRPAGGPRRVGCADVAVAFLKWPVLLFGAVS